MRLLLSLRDANQCRHHIDVWTRFSYPIPVASATISTAHLSALFAVKALATVGLVGTENLVGENMAVLLDV
jgi:hypothetical protein